MGTESSVMVALREVRRLEVERQRRQQEDSARRHAEEQTHEAAARQRATMGYAQNGGYASQQSWPGQQHDPYAQLRRTTEVVPLAAAGHPGYPQQYMDTAQAYPAEMPYSRPRSSSGKAVFFTLLLCAGAAGFGYWKLDQEFQAKLRATTVDRQQLEEARNVAVQERSKAEQEAKVKIADLEQKLKAAHAKAAAAAVVAPAEEPAPAPAVSAKAAHGKSKASKRTMARAEKAPAPKPVVEAAATEKPAATPKMAKKKSLSDDPLGGLARPQKSL